jgi:pilus assembly protein CpaF
VVKNSSLQSELDTHGPGPESATDEAVFYEALYSTISGLGPLDRIINDKRVENIDIIETERVLLSLTGDRQAWAAPIAESAEQLVQIIQKLAALDSETGREFSAASHSLDLDLPTIGRLCAIHPPKADRVCAVIRMHTLAATTLDELVDKYDMVSRVAADFIKEKIRKGDSMLIAGIPNTGKTTLARACAREIPGNKKIVTIETERELYLHLGDGGHRVNALQYRPATRESPDSLIDLNSCLSSALRLNTQHVVVGEVRNEEIKILVKSYEAGVGSLSTIHAESPTECLARLKTLINEHLSNNEEYADAVIQSAIKYIIQNGEVTDASGNRIRKVVAIAEVVTGIMGPAAKELFVLNEDNELIEKPVDQRTMGRSI